MKNLILWAGALFFLSSHFAFAANGPAASALLNQMRQSELQREKMCDVVLGNATCSSAQTPMFRSAVDNLKAACKVNLEKSGCDDLAKELGPETSDKKLRKCDDKSVCRRDTSWEQIGESCLEGVKDFGKEATDAIVGVWDKMKTSAAESRACDSDLAKKRELYDDFNKTVPAFLMVKAPAGRFFEQATCAELKSNITGTYNRIQDRYASQLVSFRMLNPRAVSKPELLPADLREYNSWLDANFAKSRKEMQDSINAIKAAWNGVPDLLKSFGVKISCYNSVTQTEIACKAASALAASLVGGAGLAAGGKFLIKLAEASGSLKVMRAVSAIEKGAETGKAPLKIIGKLEDPDRRKLVKALGILESRTEDEAKTVLDGVIAAHHVCEKSAYFKYSKLCLLEKSRILKSAGLTKPERELLMRNGVAGTYRGPGDWLIFEDGNLPNPKLALTPDQMTDNALKSIASFESKRADLNFKTDDLAGLMQSHKDLAKQIYAKSGGRPAFEPKELVTSHESMVLRAYGRDGDSVADDVLKELGRRSKEVPEYKGKSVGDLVDAESANLKKQADKLFEQATKDDNVVDYYRAKMLLETRKQVLLKADDAGISVRVDWEAADADLDAIKSKFTGGRSSNKKWVDDLEKIERSSGL